MLTESRLPDGAAASDVRASASQEREAAAYGKCRSEYIPVLQTLLASYDEARTRLKGPHKRQNKIIHSYRQGYDGTKAACYCGCGHVASIDHMEVHHIDGNPANNRIKNTAPAMPLCNKRLNGKKGGEINRQRAAAHHATFPTVAPLYVREAGAPAPAHAYAGAQWTSKEGRKHDILRGKWDALLWTLFNPDDEDLNYIGRGQLANFARSPDFVGEGTSTTFYKMIAEDVACHILKEDIEQDTQTEIVRMVWPTEQQRPKLRELVLAHSQGKISDTELADSIKALAAPRKEIRPQLNYVRWLQKQLTQGRPPK